VSRVAIQQIELQNHLCQ